MKPALFLARRVQCLQDFSHDPAVLGFEIMLPDPVDAPTKLAKLTVHAAITSLVGGKFLFPKSPVAGRGMAMFRAPVPETAVHKNCEPCFRKCKVRLSKQGLIATPAGDVVAAQKFHQGEFSILVATPANPRHELGTFRHGENVGHFRRRNGRRSATALSVLPRPVRHRSGLWQPDNNRARCR